MSSYDYILEMKGIHKTFPGVVANDHVDFAVEGGEIHGLLGENGAGKTTLMKVLFGLYHADEGSIRFKGEPLRVSSPQDAIDAGIGMVHQHFKLIPKLTVTENVVLGLRESYPMFHDDERGRGDGREDGTGRSDGSDAGPWNRLLGIDLVQRLGRALSYDQSLESDRVRTVAEEYGIDIDPEKKVWELEVGERQRVEILKALYRDVDLLILDEPTAVLTPGLIDRLFETLRNLVDLGLPVVIITHKLDEVMRITDRVTVLREGEVVGTVETSRVDESDLARMMVGRDVLLETDKERVDVGDPVVELSGLRAKNDRGVEALSGIDLTVREGEIVGLAGVSGNGQQELAESLVGVRGLEGGSIRLNGEDITGESTREFVDRGISYVPADRYRDGCAPSLSLLYNGIVKDYRDERFRSGPGGFGLDYGEARAHTERIVEDYDVRVPNVDVKTGNLSGGNLQKLILGRELTRDPKFLIANQPTRGLDVGAIEAVREEILNQRSEGTGILLISEELSEIMEMSDRIAVIYDGEIIHVADAGEASREELGLYMTSGNAAQRQPAAGDD